MWRGEIFVHCLVKKHRILLFKIFGTSLSSKAGMVLAGRLGRIRCENAWFAFSVVACFTGVFFCR